MNLITKILVAFFMMIVLAVGTGWLGWHAVEDADISLTRIVDYELKSESGLASLDAIFQSITVANRTLLNQELPLAERARQRGIAQAKLAELREREKTISEVLTNGVSHVSGWDSVLREWKTFQTNLQRWYADVGEMATRFTAWEATTILDPDQLDGEIMRYRGDHYLLAARLGRMIASGESSGPDIGASDSACGFGKWRERFEAGSEPFSNNPAITAAMQKMTMPHRIFHQTAHDVQRLIRDGFAKNRREILATYESHLKAAEEVVATFGEISAEAERSRGLFAGAEQFAMGQLSTTRDALQGELAALLHHNEENLDNNIETAVSKGQRGVRYMQSLSIAALALGALVMLWLYWSIRRHLTLPLSRVIWSLDSDAKAVTGEAEGVADSSASLSEGSGTQASALQETSAALEQISAMAKRNQDNAQSANGEMHTTSRHVAESSEAMNRMSSAMNEIKDSAEKIGNIIKTIEEIASQTNLLALNAAVEAARAGEAGKGFAVVADEVRNLAGRSAQAVKDTGELITGTVERVDNGAKISDEIADRFKTIADATGRITNMIDQIDVATAEQSEGLEQINQSVARIDGINQSNSRHAETNAQASIALKESSHNLNDQVERLRDVLQNIVGARRIPADIMNEIGGSNGNGNGHVRTGPVEVHARVAGGATRALPAPDDGGY